MYGLEKSVDLGFMVGLELQQICIGLYQIKLNFDKGLSISIESESHLIDQRKVVMQILSDYPETSKYLICLLGKKIERADNLGSGQLKLIFSDGYMLVLFDTNEDMESYIITTANREIIV